jgi:hypothetical protein
MGLKINCALFLLLIFFITGKAQTQGTTAGAASKKNHNDHIATVNYQAHDTCLNKKLSIIFHVVLDSSNNTGIAPSDLTTCVNNLNNYFKRICITFMNCSTNYIPNFNYNQWDGQIHEPMVLPNYYVDSCINIYVVQSATNPSDRGGYAHRPGIPFDVIVLEKSKLTDITPVHQMGHFFGLPHTFANPGELVNESNCATSGDGFCDTEADPYPAGENDIEPCSYTYGAQDANGNYYTPPLDNIMTWYKNCRCRFTQQQYNFMANIYVTMRSYLH